MEELILPENEVILNEGIVEDDVSVAELEMQIQRNAVASVINETVLDQINRKLDAILKAVEGGK